MASPISKHPRKGRRDVISGLPDEILFHILSFMPTKNAVQTSSLSKRWSHLWTSVPAIDINDHNPLLRYSQKRKYYFMLLVDRVLHFNDVSHLRKLCLTCNASYDLSRVIKWIKSVTIRNMEELDLSFGDKHSYDCDMCFIKDCDILGEEGGINFPLGNFTNKKLDILKLTDKGNNIILKAPTSIYLPNLKILHLHLLRFPKDDSLQNLLNGSLNLEELDIELLGSEETMLLIRSSSLKSLRVRTHCYMDATEQLRIVVDAQNIEKLDIMDDVKVLYDLKSLPSLVKVNLDHCNTCSKFIDVEGNSRLNELLSLLSNTKYLFLSCEIMKCLEYSILDNFPVFYNLHHLELKTIDYSWLVLPCLLERSPNLRTLVLYKEQSREWHLQFQTRECLMLNLEEIKFSGFKGSEDEMDMVKYFLTISKVLKKFSIKCCYSSSKKQSEIVKKLLMFPRGSTECQIIFN